MNDQEERALRALDTATANLGKLGSSTNVGKRNGIEAVYGQAYQMCVRLGLRPQLRAKYRRVQS